jgi:2EXR family
MSSQAHLQIFTNGPTAKLESNFSSFPLLPTEIRLLIWRHSLQRQRLIMLHLKSRAEQSATQTEESVASISHGERYSIIVYGYQLLSKLLRVNNESRQVALEFYRVHLPCTFVGGMTEETIPSPGIFYFNPEFDFLQISSDVHMKGYLVDFLYRMKTTYDPQRVGILNLAAQLNGVKALDSYKLEPSDLDPEVKAGFVEALTQLQEVFLVSMPRSGRQTFSYGGDMDTSEILFNRSFPIMALTPSFERLRQDPRSIAQDLKNVFVGTFDPRQTLYAWRQMLKKWGASPTQIEYRFLLSFSPAGLYGQVNNLESAKRFLEREDYQWRSSAATGSPENSQGQNQEEDLEKAVKPAFGFWLFPMDAIGALPEGISEQEVMHFPPNRGFDMSEHWPELGLLSVS